MKDRRNTDEPLRVLLADNHVMFRQGLAAFLDAHDGIGVVAWVPNDDEVPELARELRPDVVVMEARVPLEDAGASIDRMREISPPPKVVVATMREDPALMRAFRRLGASGWVPKSSRMAVLVAAIRAAASPEGGSTGAEGLGGRRGFPLPRTCLLRRTSVRTGRTATPSPSGTKEVRGTSLLAAW